MPAMVAAETAVHGAFDALDFAPRAMPNCGPRCFQALWRCLQSQHTQQRQNTMDAKPIFTKLSRDEYAALMDAAKARARVVRREAGDDFWRGASAVVMAASARAGRSAQSLALALARMLARRTR